MAEWEAKGNKTDSKTVAKDKYKNKQGSSAKNKRRATMMTENKINKIGKSSNRQGGSYIEGEVGVGGLWSEIKKKKGNKQHISTHTNTETGRVRIIERDSTGIPVTTLDDFIADDFPEAKKAIEEFFKQ